MRYRSTANLRIILDPSPNAPLLADTIPLDLLSLLCPSLDCLHHCSLPFTSELTPFDANDALTAFQAEIVDLLLGQSLEEREGLEVRDHPGVQVGHIGDGVEQSAWAKDEGVLGEQSRSVPRERLAYPFEQAKGSCHARDDPSLVLASLEVRIREKEEDFGQL